MRGRRRWSATFTNHFRRFSHSVRHYPKETISLRGGEETVLRADLLHVQDLPAAVEVEQHPLQEAFIKPVKEPTKVIISDVRPVRIHGHGDGNASAEPSPPPQTELVDPRTDPSYAKQKKRSKRAATVAAPERPEVDPEQVIQKVERFREERIAGNADASTSISVISPFRPR